MRTIHKTALLGSAAMLTLLASAPGAWAQTAPTPAPAADEPAAASNLDDVVVVGSQIRGRVTTAVPVKIIDEEQIAAVAPVSGDDLIRAIPQMGDVSFNPNNNAQTTNAARGDVGSINLRSLGVGNTLVLLNGRRIVTHPASQGLSDTGTVPVLSYNSNAIPVTGLRRLEVLLDGAAALYGTDAVAGVVNTVTRSRFDGLDMTVQYGGAEGTHLRETQFSAIGGRNFERGNLTATVEYMEREALRAEDQDFTATADLRSLFVGTSHEGLTGSDTRNTRGAWPSLQTPTANGVLRRGTTALTSAAGAFHIRPASFGCPVALSGGVCLASGALPTTGTFRNLRFDTGRGVSVMPEVQRLNLFVSGNYELSDDVSLFGELGFYSADTYRVQPPLINLNPIWIPASNYWNPFGPITFASGVTNPNRIPGLTNVPAAGLPVRLTNYRFVDAGFQLAHVENYQSRVLAGVRGERWGFDWESALVYSEAEAVDLSNSINSTALQASLALSTADAYNPFSGGCVDSPSFGDCTPSSQTAIDAISFELRRFSRTTLTMADFRASRNDLFSLPGGDVGIAMGAEVRRETQRDDRDATLDGSDPFIDSVSGEVTQSNAAPVSPNPDTYGERTVSAAYLEFAVPLVSPEMGIPLISSLEVQLAGRGEHYSDFGGVFRPKIAAAWDVGLGLRIRASYSEGFRAPNLEQINVPQVTRNAVGQDYVRCEADLRAGRITSFTRCGNNLNLSRQVAGNPDLEPEESTNFSYGVVFQPEFLPEQFGQLTFTADHWKIEQTGIVGILGVETTLAQDYLARLSGGSNPNVVRAAVTPDDVAFFAGTGIAPAGQVIALRDRFVNLLPQTVEGVDLAVLWTLDDTPLGDFDISVNATHLLTYDRDPGPAVDELLAARAAGQIDAATPLPAGSNLIMADGRPEWRVSASMNWRYGPVRIGAFTQYTGEVNETGFVNASGTPWLVESHITGNLYGQYDFGDDAGWASGTKVRVGARNITDAKPPLTSEGYQGFLYQPYGRYWYFRISREF